MKNKIITLILIIMSSISIVHAEELKNITSDVEIRYKWYKEVIEGDYYPLKEQQDDYLIDTTKIKFGTTKGWTQTNCILPDNYYHIEYGTKYVYKKVEDVRFVKLENFTFNENVKVYYNNQLINSIQTATENKVVIDLGKTYMADTLTFYITDEEEYTISLYQTRSLTEPILSKNVSGEELLIPDETWVTSNTEFKEYHTMDVFKETSLTQKVRQYQVCRSQEIYVYKYKITREYYDDNYHLNVDGYIKDTNDYQIFYQENPITNTVEITTEKIIKEPKIEYIYIPSENSIEKIDSSEIKECLPTIETTVKTEIKTIEKEIFKVPKKIYILISLLILITVFLSIKLIKKYVVQSN